MWLLRYFVLKFWVFGVFWGCAARLPGTLYKNSNVSLRTAAARLGLSHSMCQDAGPHPLRHAAKKERMIDEHRSSCAEQYILHIVL
jgi:hypothetical protein